MEQQSSIFRVYVARIWVRRSRLASSDCRPGVLVRSHARVRRSPACAVDVRKGSKPTWPRRCLGGSVGWLAIERFLRVLHDDSSERRRQGPAEWSRLRSAALIDQLDNGIYQLSSTWSMKRQDASRKYQILTRSTQELTSSSDRFTRSCDREHVSRTNSIRPGRHEHLFTIAKNGQHRRAGAPTNVELSKRMT